MGMLLLTLEHTAQWDLIVRSFANYDSYYLSGYVRGFQLHGDGDPLLFYYEDEIIRAMNVVIKRDIAECGHFQGKVAVETWFDITTPYGYGGFIVESVQGIEFDCGALEKAYVERCKKERIICEFVRFSPLLRNWEGLEKMYDVVPIGNTVCINTSDEQVIWDNFTSKNRNMIRKAVKNNLKVFWGRNPEIIPKFMELYNATMDRDSAIPYYYFKKPYYESILNDMKYNAMWFWAEVDGHIAAISIFLFSNRHMHYHLSASSMEWRCFAPTNLLLYEAALWACRNGYLKLHLGGGLGSAKDDLYTFKKAFNRQSDDSFCIGKKIFLSEEYEQLDGLRGQNCQDQAKTTFFPSYRAE